MEDYMATKTAFITGASRGIGRACAVALAQAGNRIALAARDMAKLEEVANEVRALGAEAHVVAIDMASFDSIKDFTPLSLAGSSPMVLAIHPSVPVRNVRDLIAIAKARPGQLTYVSAGIGASGHLAGALFETMTNTKMVHIPYKGMSLAVSDLIGGQVSMSFGTSLSMVPHVRTGRLRALATTGAQRSPALPDLPTVAEAAGIRGFDLTLVGDGPLRPALEQLAQQLE